MICVTFCILFSFLEKEWSEQDATACLVIFLMYVHCTFVTILYVFNKNWVSRWPEINDYFYS